MQPCATKLTIRVNGDIHNFTNSTVPIHQDGIKKEPNDYNGFTPPPKHATEANNHNHISNSTFHVDLNDTSENNIQVSSSDCSTDNEANQKQIVLYDPSFNCRDDIEAVPDPISYKLPSFQRVLPSVGAFTVQCAKCFKWRLIPSQEKYEEIREHITEMPFLCETARDWRPDVSCDDPPDIEQDGSRLWAIDKPNIAQPPPGWQRLLRIRSEGSTKFADVYYTAPTGVKLRSIPDVEKFLSKYPEYEEQGVTLARFSFQIPKPLQENYVRKRPARVAALCDAIPMALPGPEQNMDLQVGVPRFSAPYVFDHMTPTPKRARSAPGQRRHNFDFMYNHHQI